MKFPTEAIFVPVTKHDVVKCRVENCSECEKILNPLVDKAIKLMKESK